MTEYMPPQFEAAQAEQQPEQQSALAELSHDVNLWLDAYKQETAQGQADLREQYDEQVDEMFEILEQDDAYTDDELEAYFGLLSQLEETAQIDWHYHVRSVPVERLSRHFDNENSELHNLLAVGAEKASKKSSFHEERVNLATVFYRASAGRYGQPLQWLDQHGLPQEGLPEYMRPVVTDDRFVTTAFSLIPEKQPQQTNAEFTNYIRWAEQVLLERYTPIVGELSSRFRQAIAARTMLTDNNGFIIPMNKPEGGVDFSKWKNRMEAVIDSTMLFEPDELQLLYDKVGIVNFDRYSGKQLDRTLNVLQGDEITIDYLRRQDLSLSMIAAYGDYNGASNNTPRVLETEGLLICEIANASQMLRFPMLLANKVGTRFSGIIGAAHGLDGVVHLGGESNFEVVSDKKFASPDASYVDLSQAKHIGQFLHRFMKPHSKAGERLVTLISCLQGKLLLNTVNVPEAILSHVSPEDKVAVRAMPDSGNVAKLSGEDNAYMYIAGQHPMSTREYRIVSSARERSGLPQYSMVEKETFEFV